VAENQAMEKHKRTSVRIIALALVLLLFFVCLLIASLVMPKQKQIPATYLPGGYFIFYASRSEIILNEPKYGGGIIALGTDLEEIGHHKEFIFGRSGSDRGATPGYFLLNTESGEIQVGLSESVWLEQTSQAGIPSPPILIDPAKQPPVKR